MRHASVEQGGSLQDVWPGLTRLWHRRSVRGLGLALLATLLLNGTIITWWIWPEWCGPQIKLALAVSLVLVWTLGIVDGRRDRRLFLTRAATDPHLDQFLAAQGKYLQGQWTEAEQLLGQLLRESPDDVEGRLLWATMLRHQHRPVEAREQLRRLQRWNGAARWNQEIRHEWHRLAATATAPDTQVQNQRVGMEGAVAAGDAHRSETTQHDVRAFMLETVRQRRLVSEKGIDRPVDGRPRSKAA